MPRLTHSGKRKRKRLTQVSQSAGAKEGREGFSYQTTLLDTVRRRKKKGLPARDALVSGQEKKRKGRRGYEEAGSLLLYPACSPEKKRKRKRAAIPGGYKNHWRRKREEEKKELVRQRPRKGGTAPPPRKERLTTVLWGKTEGRPPSLQPKETSKGGKRLKLLRQGGWDETGLFTETLITPPSRNEKGEVYVDASLLLRKGRGEGGRICLP